LNSSRAVVQILVFDFVPEGLRVVLSIHDYGRDTQKESLLFSEIEPKNVGFGDIVKYEKIRGEGAAFTGGGVRDFWIQGPCVGREDV